MLVDELIHSAVVNSEDNFELLHHGVKGMKWGVRNVKAASKQAKKHSKALSRIERGDKIRNSQAEGQKMRNELYKKRMSKAKTAKKRGAIQDRMDRTNAAYNKQTAGNKKIEAKRKYHADQYKAQVKRAASEKNATIKLRPTTAKSKAIAKSVLAALGAQAAVSAATANPMAGLGAGIGTVMVKKDKKTRNDRFLEDVQKAKSKK